MFEYVCVHMHADYKVKMLGIQLVGLMKMLWAGYGESQLIYDRAGKIYYPQG